MERLLVVAAVPNRAGYDDGGEDESLALEYRLAALEASLTEVRLLLTATIQSQQGTSAGEILDEITRSTDQRKQQAAFGSLPSMLAAVCGCHHSAQRAEVQRLRPAP